MNIQKLKDRAMFARQSVFTCAVFLAFSLVSFVPALAAPQPATNQTEQANRNFAQGLAWNDRTEEELALRGFVATRKDPIIRAAGGRVAMDLSAFNFASTTAPNTANPSLWRHLGLLRKHGLFKVAPGIWQVRGFDISVMTIIEGKTGFIIVDPLTATEVSAAAMELVKEHVGDKPVLAVIYTHSHGDHFGGVKGVINQADVDAGKVQVIAPAGFMEHAVSENLTAGPAMSRRAMYQFGTTLPPGPSGQAGAGIGTQLSTGTITLIPPTKSIERTGELLTIDGVRFEFQVTPGTEAPAEMNFFLPDLGALCLAENANVTLHNLLPPRGAQVRDAKAWAGYLTESQRLYGSRTVVLFNSHGWPRFGREAIASYLSSHRDAYKYLHDQSVRLMNKGFNAAEIAEQISLPDVLANQWFNRGYYGTMQHNAKAIYQRYLGWYDANPVNLNGWPPEEAGKRYVAAMGGAASALKTAQTAFDTGDYRWSSEVASRIVFANKEDLAARELLARSLEQLGYQAEGMLWRNIYLTGAQEARVIPTEAVRSSVAPDLIAAVDTGQLFELLAIRIDPAKAAGKDTAVAFVFPERKERTRVTLRNSVLLQEVNVDDSVQVTVTMPRTAFLAMVFAGRSPADLIAAGILKIEGNPVALQALMSSFDGPPSTIPFGIVTP
jgi:alkyl sulfatase BDS1-like metallo-beta-lactamase superfamily hydrolase